ncbi:MAG: site-specific integrase [Verrucomicrobia bacterium]|nr:site-specific integrase [Verrucomicrobiota bacterium]
MDSDQQNPPGPPKQAVFHKVAANLYRLASSAGYYALVKRGGKQFRRSLQTADRKLAERRLADLKAQVGSLTITEDAKLGFKDVALRWLESIKHTLRPATIVQREIRINNLTPHFRGVAIRNITPRQCEVWATARGPEVAAQTFAHELELLNAVLRYSQAHGLILTNPAASLKRPKIVQAKIVVPSREQFQNLVAAIRLSEGRKDSQTKSKTGADLVEFLAYSGARLGEARQARWRDVDFGKHAITIQGTKSETSRRVIPMTNALRAFLEKLCAGEQPKPDDQIIPILSAKKCLHNACRRLGYPHFTHHDFRHFFATTCIESGVDIPTISRWLGHSDGGALAMRVYGHLRQEHSFAMIKRVDFGTAPVRATGAQSALQ